MHEIDVRRTFACTLGLMLLGLGLVACAGFTPLLTPTAAPVVSLDSLTFESAALGQRFRALDICARAEAGPDWTTRPYARIGNFVSARWCGPGVPAGDCEAGRETQPGGKVLRTISLSTLFYPSAPDNVFGLDFSARYVPGGSGWEADVSYAEGGRTVLGDGFQIAFRAVPYASDSLRPDSKRGVALGSRISYPVANSTLEYASPSAQAADFARYIAGPDSLRDAGLALLVGLRSRVEQAVQAHEVRRCVYGASPGGGMPPPCNPRPLTDAEEQAELSGARAWFAAQSALLRDNAAPMHAALLQAFPFDRCWPASP